MLALLWVLSGPPPAPSVQPWRLVTTPWLHVGVRPAVLVSPDEWALGMTVQITR